MLNKRTTASRYKYLRFTLEVCIVLSLIGPAIQAKQTADLEPVADGYVKFDESARNFADSDRLDVTAGGQRQAMLRFDLTTIPSSATIDSALLTLTCESASSTTPLTSIGVWNLIQPFDERLATYAQYAAGHPWLTPGMGKYQDYDTGPFAFHSSALRVPVNGGQVSTDVSGLVQPLWISGSTLLNLAVGGYSLDSGCHNL